MALLEELLKYSKTNGPTAIVVLLGVILIGSIGGGFWIHTLNSTIAQKNEAIADRNALIDQRLLLVDERYRNRYSELLSNYRFLNDRTEALASHLTTHRSVVFSLSDKITQISEMAHQDPSVRQALLDVSNELRNSAELLSLDAADSVADDVASAIGDMQFAEKWNRPKAAPPNFIWLLIVGVVVVLFLILFIRGRDT